MNSPGVAVAGCGALGAPGLGLEAFQAAVANNVSHLQPRDRLIGRTRSPVPAGFVSEAITSRLRDERPEHAQSRAFLFAAAALEQAILDAETHGTRVLPQRRGLVLSTTKANMDALDQVADGETCPPSAQRHIQPAFLAQDLAAHADCRGPRQCVSAACISGLLALQQGAALIRRGQADAVAVVGVDLISQFVQAGFNTLKSLDPEGCRPFDRNRIGLSLGEGAAAIVLVNEEHLRGPRIVLSGCGSSNDANHLTGPSRDGSGLALAIRRALADAGTPAGSIDYVNAHGTGTPYNDAMESLAFRSVFDACIPPLSSSKGLFGHTLGAAGVLETILCVLALRSNLLPGTARLCEPDPIAPDSLLVHPRPASRLDRVLKVNCGFGGTNAAVVLERRSS